MGHPQRVSALACLMASCFLFQNAYSAPITVNLGDTLGVDFKFHDPFLVTPNTLSSRFYPSSGTYNNGGNTATLYDGANRLGTVRHGSGGAVASIFRSTDSPSPFTGSVDFSSIRNQSIDGRIEVTLTRGPSLVYDPEISGKTEVVASRLFLTGPNSGSSEHAGTAQIQSITLNGSTIWSASTGSEPRKLDRPVTVPELVPSSTQPPDPTQKKGLILAAHGWNSTAQAWAEPLVQDIRKFVDANANHSVSWDYQSIDWSEYAAADFSGSWQLNFPRTPTAASHNAALIGSKLGKDIVAGDYDYVHLIGHSAGSWLIQAASSQVKNQSPDTKIHTTFLDSFKSPLYPLSSVKHNGVVVGDLGSASNYSEHFFNEPDLPGTSNVLKHAFNVEVSPAAPIVNPIAGHAFPYQWYSDTVGSRSAWGFPYSLEARGQFPSHGVYPRGECQAINKFDCNFVSDVKERITTDVKDFSLNLIEKSLTGIVSIFDVPEYQYGEIQLKTNSPVWALFEVDLAEELFGFYLNVFFDTSGSAEGFLAVYWDDFVLGTLDQRLVGSVENWLLALPQGYGTSGLHTLGFRLDNYGGGSAGVTINSIAGVAELVAVPEPNILFLMFMGLLALGAQAHLRKRSS